MSESVQVLPNKGVILPTINNIHNHPKIVTNEEVFSYIKSLMKRAGVFNDKEIEFAEGIASRIDRQPGLDQVTPIIQTCKDYLDKVENLSKDGKVMTPWDQMQYQNAMRKAWDYVRLTAYKQARVLIGVAQRKQHPQYSIPNLNNLLSSQVLRSDVTTVYGMGFAESRTWLTKRALENNAISHLLLIDDDILVTVDVVERLLSHEVPVISGLYQKKNITKETIVTTVTEGGQWSYQNVMVNPSREKTELVHCGCFGLGLTMISTDVFRQIPESEWYQFIHEKNPDGSNGRVIIGEDSRLNQLLMSKGIRSWVDPSIIGVHVEFKTGEHFAPDWIVDPETKRIRKEYEKKYTCFPEGLNLKELANPDNDTVFSSSTWST